MMMTQYNTYSLDQWLPAVVSFIAAAMLGSCLVYDDAFLFLYPEYEALNLLFAKVAASELHFVLQDHFLDCYQNINLVVTGLLIPALWLHMPPYSALWLWQTVFNTLLIFRTAQWLQQDLRHQTYLSYGLFFGNPMLWYALLLMPSQVILAWLVIEWLLRQKQTDAVSCLILFAISFSGSMGFIIALLICITTWLQSFFNPSKINSKPNGLSIAVLPSIVFYFIQSLNAQALAGAYLINAASPLIEWMSFSWLTFQAHENAVDLLLWIGNGGAKWWMPIPLFGLMALSGMMQQCSSQKFSFRIIFIFALLISTIVLMVPVVHSGLIPAPLILIIVMIPFVEAGISAWLNGINRLRMEFSYVVVFLILFFGWFKQPLVWNAERTHASFLLYIKSNIQSVFNTYPGSRPIVAALPFHPVLWVSLNDQNQYIPLQMAIQKEINTLDGKISGFRLGLFQTLPIQPDIILFFPEQVIAEEQQEQSLQTLPMIQEQLRSEYESLQLKQISYYQLKQKKYTELSQINTAKTFPFYSMWHLSSTNSNASGFLNYEIKLNPVKRDSDRVQWEMENDYAYTRSVGFAFGSSPNRHNSVVGTGSAVSGTGENRRLMGTLQSEPFIIHGDELQFFANMPADASPTLICLAVQQKIAGYNEQDPPRVEHIFDHHLQEPLVGDRHFYIKPEELHYEQDGIYGWKVVRVLHGSGVQGWQFVNWSMIPWKNKQAVWLAADRDRQSWMAVDHIVQRDRPKGLYWGFELGVYSEWIAKGEAFGDVPAYQPYENQLPISGMEGNFYVNSFFEGSDEHTGYLQSPTFNIQNNRLTFLVGGGDDINQVYVALVVNGQNVLRETGRQSETLRLVSWDTSEWLNLPAQIVIADQATGTWGHILADDFRHFSEEE